MTMPSYGSRPSLGIKNFFILTINLTAIAIRRFSLKLAMLGGVAWVALWRAFPQTQRVSV